MPCIYISYQQDNNAYIAQAIYHRLTEQYGVDSVFYDVASTSIGIDLKDYITRLVDSSDALLVLIGENWAHALDARGNRRLDSPNDLMRMEIERALSRQIPVLPVLIGHAEMPSPSSLPASMRTIAYGYPDEVRPGNAMSRHIEHLINGVDTTVPSGSFSTEESNDAPSTQSGSNYNRSQQDYARLASKGKRGLPGAGNPAARVKAKARSANPFRNLFSSRTSLVILSLLALIGITSTLFFTNLIPAQGSDCAAREDSFVLNEGELNSFDILANDGCSGEEITLVTIENTPSLGVTNWDDAEKTLKYKAGNKPGLDSISYQIHFSGNGGVKSKRTTAVIRIMPVNDPPRAIVDRQVASGSNPIRISPLDNDIDPDEGDMLSVTKIGTPNHGTLRLIDEANSVYEYKAYNNASAQDRIQYTISDGYIEATGEIVIDINYRNTSPIARADVFDIVASGPLASLDIQLDVLANDSDPDSGDTNNLQIINFTDPIEGYLYLDDGMLLYRLGPEGYNKDIFTYTISDGSSTSTATVTINITDGGGDQL